MPILLFHINIFKQNNIMDLCRDFGIEPVVVTDQEFSKTVGEIAGLSGSSIHPAKSGSVPFTDEMMVFCGMDSDQLDRFLEEYRRREIPPVLLKAVLTPYNAMWTPGRLCAELKKEQQIFQKK